MIRLVVFDLDGTLANTATITNGRRVPAHVLALCPPEGDVSKISFGSDVCRLPGRLIASGYEVALMTRAPSAYASTVIGLLDIDYQRIRTSVGPSVEQRASSLQDLGATSDEALYVGDADDDRLVAQQAGCRFEHPAWISGGPVALTALGNVHLGPPLPPHMEPSLEPGDLDRAANRVKRRQPIAGDAQALYDNGLWSLIIEHKAINQLLDIHERTTLSRERPVPWAQMHRDQRQWDAFVCSGDLGRLLSVPHQAVVDLLPSAALNDAVQELANRGAYQILHEVWASLPSDVRARVEEPQPPMRPIEQPTEEVDEDLADTEFHSLQASAKAAVAATALLNKPERRDRRDLQRWVFAGLNPTARHCVLDWSGRGRDAYNLFLEPRLATKSELSDDVELRKELVSAVGRMFPPVRLPHLTGQIHSLVPYHSFWGQVVAYGKQWSGKHSGSEPREALLWLPAAAVGAAVTALFGHDVTVVPVPASPFSNERPAQFSDRLGQLAANLAGVNAAHVLAKSGGEIVLKREIDLSDVVLVDDQITKGATVSKSMSVLHHHGVTVRGGVAWSSSDLALRLNDGEHQQRCWWRANASNSGVREDCPRWASKTQPNL